MESNLDHIIYRCLSDVANEDERAQLQKWLDKSSQNQRLYHVLKSKWPQRIPEPNMINEEEMLEKIWQEGINRTKTPLRHRFIFIAKVAASLAIILSLGFLIFNLLPPPNKELSENSIQQIIKKNPIGEKSRLLLSDGTVVWLNAESSIRYLEGFTESKREVTLEGEAYFEVAKDSLRPFRVITSGISTEALGTAFNINSFPENNEIDIKLISGKVEISSQTNSFLLHPHQAVSFERGINAPKKYDFDPGAIVWKDGIMVFVNSNFGQVERTLERWYGIHIHVEGRTPTDWQISGKFDNKYLSEVLELMQYSRDFEYHIDNKDLYIKFH